MGETLTLSVEGLINPFFEPGFSVDVRLALQGSVAAGALVVFLQTAPPGSNGITNFCGGNGFCASLTASIQLRANSPGTLPFDFSAVSFFGATLGQGTQVTVVPEPASAGLLGLGLCAVALGRRRGSRTARHRPPACARGDRDAPTTRVRPD